MKVRKKIRKRKQRKTGTSAPWIVVICVCAIGLGVSIWQIAGTFFEYQAAAEEYEGLRQQYTSEELTEEEEAETEDESLQRMTLSDLQALNPDTVGWIEIPETQISYPLMQTEDNAYYLSHSFSGEENSSGSIFVETLNSADFTDLHTIIYGHNMKNGSMFAGLHNYSSPSYLVAHPVIYLDLEDGTHEYRIFSVYEAEADSDSYTIGFSPDEQYEEFLRTIKARSEYDTGVTVTKEDFIITLSTCSKSGEKRYLVHAKKVS